MLSFFTWWIIFSIAGSGASAALWGWRGAAAVYGIALAIGLPYWVEWGSHVPGHAVDHVGIGAVARILLILSTLWCIGGLPSAAIGLGLRWIKGR
jgi:hypothetical protein